MKRLLVVATLAACAFSAFATVAPSADGSFTSRRFTTPVSTAMVNESGKWGVDDELTEVVLQ